MVVKNRDAIELGDKLALLNEHIKLNPVISARQAESLDRHVKGALAVATNGMSLFEVALAYMDWISHFVVSPGRQLYLLQGFAEKLISLAAYSVNSYQDINAEPITRNLERRVSSDNWKRWPFAVFAQGHQLSRDWLREVVENVSGVSEAHTQMVQFISEQMIEAVNPANFLLTNPDLIEATRAETGRNLLRGARFFIKDIVDRVRDAESPTPKGFVVGENVATSQGYVIYQNEMMELIQYKPNTPTVGANPVLVCPAWIMKYYILDLSPKSSMVKYLVDQGKTVFMISWKNPREEDRDVGFEDYLNKGLLTAVDVLSSLMPKAKINAVGYCIGGTLLSIGAAYLSGKDDDRINSITLFAAQVDFTEAGDLLRYVSPSQLDFVDGYMWKKGVLSSQNMGSAFAALQASDLLYGSMVERYILGKDYQYNDLMAWNADGTRMPHRMHSEYLHRLYLHNELSRNKFEVNGDVVSLKDIRAPFFVVGTETDHVAPWQSVYKINDTTNTDITFLLTSGGHNAGIISGPEHPRRRYRVSTKAAGDKYRDPNSWLAGQSVVAGSWWPYWNAWLTDYCGELRKPPSFGSVRKGYQKLRAAPGDYVFG